MQVSKLSKKTSKTTNKSFGSESFKGQVPAHINRRKKRKRKVEAYVIKYAKLTHQNTVKKSYGKRKKTYRFF